VSGELHAQAALSAWKHFDVHYTESSVRLTDGLGDEKRRRLTYRGSNCDSSAVRPTAPFRSCKIATDVSKLLNTPKLGKQ
jgi:hypothetical protein